MKVLLDENIDIRFKTHLEIYTVNDMHWNSIKNGELLKLIAQHNFNCWIVADKNIPYQQNISKLPCLIIVLDVFRNTLKHLLPLIPAISEALNTNATNEIIILKE